jgi:ABC-type protease/lipase transport system fused ATPase/permease subunit
VRSLAGWLTRRLISLSFGCGGMCSSSHCRALALQPTSTCTFVVTACASALRDAPNTFLYYYMCLRSVPILGFVIQACVFVLETHFAAAMQQASHSQIFFALDANCPVIMKT